jgi:DNA processing protein
VFLGWPLFTDGSNIPRALVGARSRRDPTSMIDDPVFVPAAHIWALRGERARPAKFSGLYVQGNIEALACPTVAIVGTRAPSDYGRRVARRMASDLGAAGICVVSGLAYGIDAAAHSGSLSIGAVTVGVLGGGHSYFFPRRNRELAATMVENGGAVLSPFAPDEPPLPYRFLQRNGVIAALADAVVVIEAPLRSGALNTATWAANSNVPVLAVPGEVDRTKAAGCHVLIRDGATLARDYRDVLEAIGIVATSNKPITQSSFDFPAPSLASQLARNLSEEALSVETLAARHGKSIGEMLGILGHLSLAGIIELQDDGYYALKAGRDSDC